MAIPITKKLKINLKGVKLSDRESAMSEVAEYLEDTILDKLSKGESPVKGQPTKFRGLSESYKKIKTKISGSTKPNMELFGDMLDDFSVKVKGNSLTIGIHKDASDESKLKAENHNKFTKRSMKRKKGKYIVPKRQFIPKKKEKFRPAIRKELKEIAENYLIEQREIKIKNIKNAKRINNNNDKR